MDAEKKLPRKDWNHPFVASVAYELEEAEEIIRKHLQPPDSHLAPAAGYVRSLGGKRLRPMAFLLMIKAAGKKPRLPHIVVAAVLELCHTASLLHDDVLDQAQLRRGAASLSTLRGNREAVLFGDYLLSGAFQLLADLARPELIVFVAELVSTVCSGEIKQWGHRGLTLTRRGYIRIVEAKTASFFKLAGFMAGHMASLNRDLTDAFAAWGNSFGTAYQIYDDLYDLLAPASAEKSTGRDTCCGLVTLPWICLRERHGVEAMRKAYFTAKSENLHSPDSKLSEHPRIRRAVLESAAIARNVLEAGTKTMDSLAPSKGKEALLGLSGQLGNKLKALVSL